MAAVFKPLRKGQVVAGHYKIQRKIGEGGFGDVYLAHHIQQQRDVAIKTLRQEENPNLPDLVQRFEREVRLASKLDHPNIVRTFDNGRLESGQLYMVMEYIRGEELENILRRERKLGMERATHIILQILDALASAHGHGVVHRDLKPSNVMLCNSGLRQDVVKLLDFGIAKAFDGTYADLTAQNLTEGVGFGTPQYMSPEQILGRNIGPHTDLYATGLIWIELVTGIPPMLAPEPTDTIKRQLQDDVPIPVWLAQSPVAHILNKALEKEWEDRYAGAADMYRDIDAVMRGRSALANVVAPSVPVVSGISGGFPTVPHNPSATEVTDNNPTVSVDSGPTVVVQHEYEKDAQIEDVASMPTAMVGPQGVMPGGALAVVDAPAAIPDRPAHVGPTQMTQVPLPGSQPILPGAVREIVDNRNLLPVVIVLIGASVVAVFLLLVLLIAR